MSDIVKRFNEWKKRQSKQFKQKFSKQIPDNKIYPELEDIVDESLSAIDFDYHEFLRLLERLSIVPYTVDNCIKQMNRTKSIDLNRLEEHIKIIENEVNKLVEILLEELEK